jgi:hypothetical protein
MTDAESEDLPAVSNEQVVGMRERGYVALSNARIREVSGHSKLMWFLPAFVLVLALVSIALWKDPSERPLAQFWALMAIAVAAVIPLVSHCRYRDRKFLRWLFDNRRAVWANAATFEGRPVTAASVLVRYEVHVGFVVIDVTFHTPYRPVGHPSIRWDRAWAIALTLVLGWWAIPWGPFAVVTATLRNLKGGASLRADKLLRALAGLPL